MERLLSDSTAQVFSIHSVTKQRRLELVPAHVYLHTVKLRIEAPGFYQCK